ncbi:MAG: hemagglutinin repeat-containing protein [Candidatus Thiodiazotropha endolucinida]
MINHILKSLPALLFLVAQRTDADSESYYSKKAKNGAPVLDIRAPNKHGLSHNKVNEFDVKKEGFIFNNSPDVTYSYIGGFVKGNPNLRENAQQAKHILLEVGGKNKSKIGGPLEITGGGASLTIASKNGITTYGKHQKAYNVRHLTYSTGEPRNTHQENWHLSVTKGTVDLNGTFNTDPTQKEWRPVMRLQSFNILSRTINHNGKIKERSGKKVDVKMVSGPYKYDMKTGDVSSLEEEKDIEEAARHDGYGISGGELGSIYGDKVQFIATETRDGGGIGVKHKGFISASEFTIDSKGDVNIGRVNVSGDFKIKGEYVKVGTNNQDGEDEETAISVVKNNLSIESYNTSIQGDVHVGGSADFKTENQFEIFNVVTADTVALDANKVNITSSGYLISRSEDINSPLKIKAKKLVSSGLLISKGHADITADNFKNTSGFFHVAGDLKLTTRSYLNENAFYELDGKELFSISSGGKMFLTMDECCGLNENLPVAVNGLHLDVTHDIHIPAGSRIDQLTVGDLSLHSVKGNIRLDADMLGVGNLKLQAFREDKDSLFKAPSFEEGVQGMGMRMRNWKPPVFREGSEIEVNGSLSFLGDIFMSAKWISANKESYIETGGDLSLSGDSAVIKGKLRISNHLYLDVKDVRIENDLGRPVWQVKSAGNPTNRLFYDSGRVDVITNDWSGVEWKHNRYKYFVNDATRRADPVLTNMGKPAEVIVGGNVYFNSSKENGAIFNNEGHTNIGGDFIIHGDIRNVAPTTPKLKLMGVVLKADEKIIIKRIHERRWESRACTPSIHPCLIESSNDFHEFKNLADMLDFLFDENWHKNNSVTMGRDSELRDALIKNYKSNPSFNYFTQRFFRPITKNGQNWRTLPLRQLQDEYRRSFKWGGGNVSVDIPSSHQARLNIGGKLIHTGGKFIGGNVTIPAPEGVDIDRKMIASRRVRKINVGISMEQFLSALKKDPRLTPSDNDKFLYDIKNPYMRGNSSESGASIDHLGFKEKNTVMIGSNNVMHYLVNKQLRSDSLVAYGLTKEQYEEAVNEGINLRKKHHLDIGSQLPEEVALNLKRMVVVFVYESVEGKQIVWPKLYLSSKMKADATIQEQYLSVLNTGGGVYSDADEVMINQGLVKGKNIHFRSKSDIVIDDSSLLSKEDLTIQTEGDFKSKGGKLVGSKVGIIAKGDVDLEAHETYGSDGKFMIVRSSVDAKHYKVSAGKTIKFSETDINADNTWLDARDLSTTGVSRSYFLGDTNEVRAMLPTTITGENLTFNLTNDWHNVGSRISVKKTRGYLGGSFDNNPSKFYSKEETDTGVTVEYSGYINSELQLGDAIIDATGAEIGGTNINANCDDSDFSCSFSLTARKDDILAKAYRNVTTTRRRYSTSSMKDLYAISDGAGLRLARRLGDFSKKLGSENMSLSPYTAIEALGFATQLAFDDALALTLSEENQSIDVSESSALEQEGYSTIKGNVDLKSLKGSIDMKGVNLGDKNSDVTIVAAKDFRLKGTSEKGRSQRDVEIETLSSTFSAGCGNLGCGIGANISYGESSSHETTQYETNTLSMIQANKLKISVGGHLVFDHAFADSNSRQIHVGGDTILKTKQDTYFSEMSNKNWHIDLGIAENTFFAGIPIPTISGGGGESHSKTEKKWVHGRAGFLSNSSKDLLLGDLTKEGSVLQSREGSVKVEGEIFNKSLTNIYRQSGDGYDVSGGISNTGIPFLGGGWRLDDNVYHEEEVLPIMKNVYSNKGIDGEYASEESQGIRMLRDEKTAGVDAQFQLAPPKALITKVNTSKKRLKVFLGKIKTVNGKKGIPLSPTGDQLHVWERGDTHTAADARDPNTQNHAQPSTSNDQAPVPAQSNPIWRLFDNEQSQTTLRSEADSKRQVEIMKLMYANKDIDQELIRRKYISSVPAEKLSEDIRLASLWMKSIGMGPSTKQKSNIELMDDTILEIALSIKDGFDNHKPVSIEQIKTKYGISNKLAIEYYETAKSLARMYGDESVINPEMAITGMDMKSSPGKQNQPFDINTPAQAPAQSNPFWRPFDNEQSQTTLRSEADSTSSGLLPLLGEQTNIPNPQALLDVTTFDGKEVYDIPNIKEVYNKPNILDITTFEGKKVYDISNIQMDIMKLMYHYPSVTLAKIRSLYHSNETQIRMSTERSRLWLRSLNTATDEERKMLTTSHKRAIEIAESIIANSGKIISTKEIMAKYNITYYSATKLRANSTFLAKVLRDENVIDSTKSITRTDMKSRIGKQSQLFDIDTPAQVPALSNDVSQPLDNEQSQTTLRSEADSASSGLLPLLGEQTNNSNLQALLDLGRKIGNENPISQFPKRSDPVSVARAYGDESVINPESPITGMDMISRIGKQIQPFDINTPAQVPALSNDVSQPLDNEQSQTTLRSEADFEGKEVYDIPNIQDITTFEGKEVYDISNIQMDIMKLMYHNPSVTPAQIRSLYKHSTEYKIRRSIERSRLWLRSLNTATDEERKKLTKSHKIVIEIAESIIAKNGKLIQEIKDKYNITLNRKLIQEIKDKYNITFSRATMLRAHAVFLAKVLRDESVIDSTKSITRTDMKSRIGKQIQLFDIDTPAQVPAQSNDVSQPLDNEQSQTTLQKRLLGKRDAERAVDDMRNKRARKDELDSVPVPLEDPVNNSVQLPIVTPPGEGEVDMN